MIHSYREKFYWVYLSNYIIFSQVLLSFMSIDLIKSTKRKKNNLDKHRKKLFKILYNLHKRCVLIDPINGKTLP